MSGAKGAGCREEANLAEWCWQRSGGHSQPSTDVKQVSILLFFQDIHFFQTRKSEPTRGWRETTAGIMTSCSKARMAGNDTQKMSLPTPSPCSEVEVTRVTEAVGHTQEMSLLTQKHQQHDCLK